MTDIAPKTIMTVDDSPSMRMLLRAALTDLGYTVIEAEDGVQRQGAVVAQQGQPGADGPGDRRGEQAGAGYQLEAEALEGLDARAGGGDPHHPGAGLGLPIVRAIARRAGGDARVEPSDRGCVILLTLPLAAADAPSGRKS